MICPYCQTSIPNNANNCPSCGAQVFQQQAQQPVQQTSFDSEEAKKRSRWMAITSMVLGILSIACSFGIDEFDEDEALGLLLFIILALVFGIISLCQKRDGKEMSIAGIVTAGIAFLLAI